MIHSTLIKIDEQIHLIQNMAERVNKEWVDRGEDSPNLSASSMQNEKGEFLMTPLLLARSNCLLAIAMDTK